MTQPVAKYDSVLEEHVLRRLRHSYEDLGYEFVVHPPADRLPAFMDGYLPDAIAIRDDDRIAIEVRGGSYDHSGSIAAIARRFQGRTDWRFNVTFGDEPLAPSPVPRTAIRTIRERADEVRRMVEDGYVSAALVMAFSILEATARLIQPDGRTRGLNAGTVVQTLTMDGLLSQEQAERLYPLVAIRHAVAHGEDAAPPTPDAVMEVLAAADTSIANAFAR